MSVLARPTVDTVEEVLLGALDTHAERLGPLLFLSYVEFALVREGYAFALHVTENRDDEDNLNVVSPGERRSEALIIIRAWRRDLIAPAVGR